MSGSDRDTHFQNFAKHLWDEIEDEIIVIDDSKARHYHPLVPKVSREIKLLIARRAYDLVAHVLGNEAKQWEPLEEISVRDIPDLTIWTKENEHGV